MYLLKVERKSKHVYSISAERYQLDEESLQTHDHYGASLFVVEEKDTVYIMDAQGNTIETITV